MSRPQRIPEPRCPDVTFRHPMNWQVALFFALVGFAHLLIALPSLRAARWEGWLGLGLANLSLIAALVAVAWQREVAVLASLRQVRLRDRLVHFHTDHYVSFNAIRGVKVTLVPGKRGVAERVSLQCADEQEIELPPVQSPRAEALLLAIMLKTPMTTVSQESAEITPAAPRGGFLLRRLHRPLEALTREE